jgi:ADP-ribosylglycohydrolase
LKITAYGILAQFWTTLGLKEEMWEDDAKNLLLLQKALIEKAQATLKPYLDDSSMKRFNDYVEQFKARIVFSEDQKAKRFHKK